MTHMRDKDVRSALHKRLLVDHATDLDSTLFVDELSLCGEVRVDVAVVNASLSGFELKSASDTLRRLPAQVEVYSRVLDYCTIVVAENHLDRAMSVLPAWWGCIVVRWDGIEASLDELAVPALNSSIDGYSLAQLLWRDEAIEVLEELDAVRGYRTKPRKLLWQRLAQVAEIDILRPLVRNRLKARQSWRPNANSIRSGRELFARGAMCPPLSTSSDCL